MISWFRRGRHRASRFSRTVTDIRAELAARAVGEFTPPPDAELVGDKMWIIRPGPRTGEWSPFDPDGRLDWPRLKGEGWVQVGAMKDGDDDSA